MEYRILPPAEFDRLRFIFEPKGLPIPDPNLERVVSVEDQGNIVAIGILRLLPLLDGLWVEKAYRGGRVDYRKAGSILLEPLTERPGSRCYSLSVGPARRFTRHILNQVGFKEIQGTLFEKGY